MEESNADRKRGSFSLILLNSKGSFLKKNKIMIKKGARYRIEHLMSDIRRIKRTKNKKKKMKYAFSNTNNGVSGFRRMFDI